MVPLSRTVVFAVPADVHLLDLAGPAQVFATADDVGGGPGGAYRLCYVSLDGSDAVVSHQGLRLQVQRDWPELGDRDLVVVPGWRVGDRAAGRPLPTAAREALLAHHERGGRIARVPARVAPRTGGRTAKQGWTQDAAARAPGLADARVLRRLRAAVASPPTGSR